MPGGDKLRRELSRLGELVGSVCEHRTTKCCCECGNETKQASLERRPDKLRSSSHNKQLARQLAEVARRRDHPTPHEVEARKRRTDFNRRDLLKCAPFPPLPDPPDPYPDGAIHSGSSSPRSTSDSDPTSAHSAEAPLKARLSRWGLRVCSTPQCRNRIACRDVNADKNFLNLIGWSLTRGRPGPTYLLPKAQRAAEEAYWLAYPW
jgi:hypothetical protein